MGTYFKHVGLMAVLVSIWGCSKKAETRDKAPPAAKVQNAVRETDLATIVLAAEAESRLGIETATVEYRSVTNSRTFGGEVVSVPGRSVTVSAPVSGTLLSPPAEAILIAGGHVRKEQPLYRLLLALPEKNLLEAREELSLRKIEFDLAQVKAQRAQQLLDGKTGSVRECEDAQAQLAKAAAALEIAQVRMDLVSRGELDSTADGLSVLTIKSPVDGVVQRLHVAPGQTVTAATALLEIAGIDPVWIRVPVYVGDLAEIAPNQPAHVHSLADLAGVEARIAEPVAAPLGANPQSITVDLLYELSNADSSYRPGQKVGVTVALGTSQERLVVPYSSILYDMYGSAWVYQRSKPYTYVRQRVGLLHVLEGLAVLSRGPAAGSEVVSAGAAELFGTEFGVGK